MFRTLFPSAMLMSLPLLGGCDSVSRLSDFDPRSSSVSSPSTAPISATPTPTVTAQELPPPPPRFLPGIPASPPSQVTSAPPTTTLPSGEPQQLPGGVPAPAAGDLSPPAQAGSQTKIAAATRRPVEPTPRPAETTPEKPSQSRLTGGWSVAQGSGSKCKLTLSNAPALDLYKAQTTGCSTGLTKVNAWELRGDEIYLYEQGGGVAARLKQSGTGSFNGAVAKSGAPVSINK